MGEAILCGRIGGGDGKHRKQAMNHWKPNGNCFVGDCMPFFRDGVFHLYYLLDIGHHNHPVVGTLGGHQYAHASSSDLIHWKQEPLALPLDFEQGECSNCTGSMLEYQGRVYAFYALRSRHFRGERIRLAVSDDGGISFRKLPPPEIPMPPDCRGYFRDPMAFIGEDGRIHLLISSGAEAVSGGISIRKGAVAHYITSDLQCFQRADDWADCWYTPECCDYFRWNGLYYYTFNNIWETHVRCSEKPFGPWRIPLQDVPASQYCCVMKSAPWKDGRRIGVGWVPSWEAGGMSFGGPVFGGRTVFREMVQEADGSLGTRFVEEMIPGRGEKTFPDAVLASEKGIDVCCPGIFARDFRLDGEVAFQPGTREFGLMIADRDQNQRRYVSFYPDLGIVELDRHARICRVPMNERKVSFRLVRTEDVIDLEIDGHRTVVTGRTDFPESLTVLYVREGAAHFRRLRLFVR